MLTHISKYPAILIKNLPYKNADDISAICKGFSYDQMNYEFGSGFREELAERVYSASDEPDNFCIDPHNEMSYLPNSPSKVCS